MHINCFKYMWLMFAPDILCLVSSFIQIFIIVEFLTQRANNSVFIYSLIRIFLLIILFEMKTVMLGRLHCFSKALIYSLTILGKIARNFVIYFYMHLLKDQILVKSLYMQLLASLKEQLSSQ